MTAVIGFHTKDAVILATDSQMTAKETKRLSSTKLWQVDFKGGHKALIARSGSIDGADIFHEIFAELASDTEITGWRTAADTAETALKRAKAKIIENAGYLMAKSAGRKYLEELHHQFLLANVFHGASFLFCGDSVGGFTKLVSEPFEAIGSGREVAGFILDGMKLRLLAEHAGHGLAAYTIGMCKRANIYCAGPLQLGTIDLKGECTIFDERYIRMMEAAVEKTDEAVTATLGRQISLNFTEEYLKDLQARVTILEKNLGPNKTELLVREPTPSNRKARK
ncbi:MAG TPA: hypothetical protein VHC86_01350 [Opitutaceae bacterium]|nr:hypothetical protein [Opitutaceae bacterium]